MQELAQLDRLLAPVTQRFGAEKGGQVEKFLRLQAQLGLKHKVETMTADRQLQESMAAEIVELRREVDTLRRAIGVYCMSYVRSIPPTRQRGGMGTAQHDARHSTPHRPCQPVEPHR